VPLPALAVKLMFGQMGQEVLLAGQRVAPRRLQELGFAWEYPQIEGALRAELGIEG
jgi:NAD dependent epimerase/dehydratase family enzyme